VTRRPSRERPSSGAKGVYVPERGDVVWLDFDPQSGREQAGRRPALVISPASYNGSVGLAIVLPVTNQIKGYPYEVVIPKVYKATGCVLSDQVKSLDWRNRKAALMDRLPESLVSEAVENALTLLAPGGNASPGG
jgi:mRNA interferase MazF